MQVAILSDDQAAAESLRSALSECGLECPIDRVWPTETSNSLLNGGSSELDALFFLLTEEEPSLARLESLCINSATRVVAVGSARDPRFIMRVIHAGPSDYLDIDGELVEDLKRALGRLQNVPAASSSGGKVISVFAHCGGAGCSLVATNLAVALAEAHDECLLCDFNVRRGDLATLLNLKPQFSVNDISKNLAKLQGDIFEQTLTAHDSGVQLLAAPSSFTDVRPVPSEAVNRIISLARQSFPFMVADLEDFFHPEQFELLRQSDTILFVMRLDYTALRNARRTLEYLERDGLDLDRVQIVVNQCGRPKELTVSQAEEVLARPLDHVIPYEPKVVIPSVNRGAPLMQSAPRSKAARAIRKVAEGIEAPATRAVKT